MTSTFKPFREAKILIALATPIIITQLLQISTMVVDTLMAGRANATELSGVAVGSSLWVPLFLMMIGTLGALTPTVAQSLGARDFDDIPFQVSQSFWKLVLLLPVGFSVALVIKPVFVMMDVSDTITPIATGLGIEALLDKYEKEHDDYNSIMVKALADRLAEAFAEHLHERVRREHWGYATDETLNNEALIKEKYRGIRPAPGYPACPDHTEKAALFKLLDAEKNTGLTLTDSFAMSPAAAVSGWYFGHPESKYFNTGKIDKDQLASLAERKSMPVDDLARWLSPILD